MTEEDVSKNKQTKKKHHQNKRKQIHWGGVSLKKCCRVAQTDPWKGLPAALGDDTKQHSPEGITVPCIKQKECGVVVTSKQVTDCWNAAVVHQGAWCRKGEFICLTWNWETFYCVLSLGQQFLYIKFPLPGFSEGETKSKQEWFYWNRVCFQASYMFHGWDKRMWVVVYVQTQHWGYIHASPVAEIS